MAHEAQRPLSRASPMSCRANLARWTSILGGCVGHRYPTHPQPLHRSHSCPRAAPHLLLVRAVAAEIPAVVADIPKVLEVRDLDEVVLAQVQH